MNQCEICQRKLKGREKRFCSVRCKNDHWARARKRGNEVPGFTDPNPEINAFLQDFKELLLKHTDGVNALGAKRKF